MGCYWLPCLRQRLSGDSVAVHKYLKDNYKDVGDCLLSAAPDDIKRSNSCLGGWGWVFRRVFLFPDTAEHRTGLPLHPWVGSTEQKEKSDGVYEASERTTDLTFSTGSTQATKLPSISVTNPKNSNLLPKRVVFYTSQDWLTLCCI